MTRGNSQLTKSRSLLSKFICKMLSNRNDEKQSRAMIEQIDSISLILWLPKSPYFFQKHEFLIYISMGHTTTICLPECFRDACCSTSFCVSIFRIYPVGPSYWKSSMAFCQPRDSSLQIWRKFYNTGARRDFSFTWFMFPSLRCEIAKECKIKYLARVTQLISGKAKTRMQVFVSIIYCCLTKHSKM